MSSLNLFLLSLSEIFGDFSLKNFARSGNKTEFIKGSAGYVAVIYFLIKCLKQGNILYVNGMWDGLSALMEGIAAYLILGEKLKTPQQYVGLGFIVLGVFLLKLGGISY